MVRGKGNEGLQGGGGEGEREGKGEERKKRNSDKCTAWINLKTLRYGNWDKYCLI